MDSENTTDVGDNKVVALWNELRALIEEVEPDLLKNARGVAAAGVRARKGLRAIKAKASELVKTTVELDKAGKAAEKT